MKQNATILYGSVPVLLVGRLLGVLKEVETILVVRGGRRGIVRCESVEFGGFIAEVLAAGWRLCAAPGQTPDSR